MNMFNKLPHFVYLDNEKFFINTDFRIFIEFELEMQGKNKREASYKCLGKFYPAFFRIINKGLLEQAVDKFLWFYKCGKTDEQVKHSNKSNKNLRLYDYNYDSDLIWGAFYGQFKVDLSTFHIHWWKFKAMWNSLDRECEFSKIRGYRAYNGKDKELLELKELYKLPPTEFEQDERKRHQQIFEQLNKIKSSQ